MYGISENRSPADGDKYFKPSLAKTAEGKFIDAAVDEDELVV